MTDTRTISPVDGRKVRFPGAGQVLSEPTPVVWDSYWERLRQAGDIAVDETEAVPAKAAPASPPTPPASPAAPAAASTKVN